MSYPRRVACLSAESAELCATLGIWDRVVAVTVYFDQSNLEPKPVVSGFSKLALSRLQETKPDLVITFSDVQADLARDLIREGYTVVATNQRTLAEIADTILFLSRLLGVEEKGLELHDQFQTALRPLPPTEIRVYFEEWDAPPISGISWVSEIIQRAGGIDVFENLRSCRKASERVVTSEQVIEAAPDLILASWCGKTFEPSAMMARPGWGKIPAVAEAKLFEVPAADILQPGVGLIRGFDTIATLLQKPRHR